MQDCDGGDRWLAVAPLKSRRNCFLLFFSLKKRQGSAGLLHPKNPHPPLVHRVSRPIRHGYSQWSKGLAGRGRHTTAIPSAPPQPQPPPHPHPPRPARPHPPRLRRSLHRSKTGSQVPRERGATPAAPEVEQALPSFRPLPLSPPLPPTSPRPPPAPHGVAGSVVCGVGEAAGAVAAGATRHLRDGSAAGRAAAGTRTRYVGRDGPDPPGLPPTDALCVLTDPPPPPPPCSAPRPPLSQRGCSNTARGYSLAGPQGREAPRTHWDPFYCPGRVPRPQDAARRGCPRSMRSCPPPPRTPWDRPAALTTGGTNGGGRGAG